MRFRRYARTPLRAFPAASCRIARLTTAAAVAPCVRTPYHPSLAMRRYMLLRDRFVRIPLNGADADSVPGDEFELHAYLLRTCCEQVRLHANTHAASHAHAHARTHACSCAH